ncbi:MAG: 4Fe-4S binding protein [Cyanobacteriota bacterium]|jgi:ferredoxin
MMSYTIPEDCPACGKCLIHCPTQAIKVKDDQFSPYLIYAATLEEPWRETLGASES